MNIETKQVRYDVNDYLKFGWEHTQDVSVRFGPRHRKEHILVRDKDMPKYQVVVAYENKYFYLKRQLKELEEVSGLVAFALFLFFIFPGVIYLVLKNNNNKRIIANNNAIKKQMNKILVDVSEIL